MFREGEPAHGGFKLRGEWADLLFMTRAAQHGLRVIKPWGDSSRYDFVVETGGRFLRVQVNAPTAGDIERTPAVLKGVDKSVTRLRK